MKVTKSDIYAIKAGKSKKFIFDNYADLRSIRTYIYNELNRYTSRPGDVSKYTTHFDSKEMSLTVTAHKKETV